MDITWVVTKTNDDERTFTMESTWVNRWVVVHDDGNGRGTIIDDGIVNDDYDYDCDYNNLMTFDVIAIPHFPNVDDVLVTALRRDVWLRYGNSITRLGGK